MEALKMESEMNRSWSDDRLDELNRRVEKGFVGVDQHFERVEDEMKEGFAKVDRDMKEGFAEVKAELARLNDRFDDRFDRLSMRIDRISYILFAAGVGALISVLAGAPA